MIVLIAFCVLAIEGKYLKSFCFLEYNSFYSSLVILKSAVDVVFIYYCMNLSEA